jgi:hypothetical protein
MPKRFKYVSLVAHIGEVDISNFVTGKKKCCQGNYWAGNITTSVAHNPLFIH